MNPLLLIAAILSGVLLGVVACVATVIYFLSKWTWR